LGNPLSPQFIQLTAELRIRESLVFHHTLCAASCQDQRYHSRCFNNRKSQSDV